MSGISPTVFPASVRDLTFTWQRRTLSGAAEERAIYETVRDLQQRGKSHPERAAARRIEPGLIYMLKHLDQPPRVSELCSVADVSCSHFFELFKRATGDTPIRYFTRARMRRARTLLRRTSMSVKEVAASLGYDDEFYFSRVFKSMHRLAPSHFRAECEPGDHTHRLPDIDRAGCV